MGTQNSNQIRVAPKGDVYVAATSVTVPTDTATAWAAGWVKLGLVNSEGVTFTETKSMVDVRAWQMAYPARRVVETKEAAVSFSLAQWSGDTVKLAFGGGAVTGTGPYTYAPPAADVVDERALGIEWTDGASIYRIVVPRGVVSDDVETTFSRTDAAYLPISFSVIGPSPDAAGLKANPWYMVTSDTLFNT
jgi:hypothetical protein